MSAPLCPNTTTSEVWVDNLYHGVFQVAFPVLIAFGTLTNLTNLLVLTRPAMRSRTYRWLRVLAGVDLSLCLLTIPVCLSNGGHRASPSSSAAHYYAHFGWSLSIGAQILSFYLMGWFAFERFLAVCCHQRYQDSQTTAIFRRTLAGTVVFVVILYLPTMIVGSVCMREGAYYPMDGYHKIKTKEWPGYVWYTWFREVFSRLVPAVVLTVCNVSIARRLKQLRSIRDGFGSGVSPARRERERRLVLLLFWVTILFYFFNAPVMVYYLGFLNYPGNHDAPSLLAFAAISNFFQMAGNISNFLLYFLINPEFRRGLREIFRSGVSRCRGEEQHEEQGNAGALTASTTTPSATLTPTPTTNITTPTSTSTTTLTTTFTATTQVS